MATLDIGGQKVQVGDEFLKLSPAEQNATVEEIAKTLKPAAPAAAPEAAAPITANDVVRSTAEGVPVVGGILNKLNAVTNAALAPAVEPFLTPSADDISRQGEGFGERYRKSLAIQEGKSKKFAEEHPIVDTAAKITGGVAGSLPIMKAAPAAFGLTGTLPQMVVRGAASNAALAGADAAVRGENPVTGAELGAIVGGAAPVVGRLAGKAIGGVRNLISPAPAPIAQNTVEVAGRKIPLTKGQMTADPALQAEEEIMRRGAAGSSAEDIARQADEAARSEIAAATRAISEGMDPTRQVARTAPQAAGELVGAELTAQRAAQDAAITAAEQRSAAQRAQLATDLGGGAPPVDPYTAAESVGSGVAAQRDAARGRTREAYDALKAAPGEFDPSVPKGIGEDIRTRLNTGDDPLWVDPDTTSMANDAIKLLDQTIGKGIFKNAAAGPVAQATEAAERATPGGGAPAWQARANTMVEEMIAQGINPTRARAAAAAAEGGPMAAHEVAVPGGGSVAVQPKVVEASSIKTSADAGYDPALQPRNRARAASDAQVNDIAGNLNPSRLGVSSEADRGAPIIGPDGMVESGNGRTLALRRAYAQNGPQAKAYREWLESQGVDVSKFKEPILVRERTTEMTPAERQAFTVGSNQSATLSLSAPERALADARSITADSLDSIRNPGDLGAVENRDFVRQFISKLPQTEQGAMVTASGDLSAEGLARVRNAVLAKAYGDTPILSRVAESTKDDIRSISNALTAAAPEWAALKAAVERGQVPAELDITKELLDAVGRTAKIRAKGTSLESAMAQRDAFGAQSPESERIMRMFYGEDGKSAASSAKIADGLRHYAQEALKVDAAPGLGLGLAPVTAKDILEVSAKKVGAPAAVAADVVEKGMAAADAVAAGEIAPRIGLKEMDAARKRLVTMYGDARKAAMTGSGSDERAMARILHEFDNAIIDAFETGKFSGDAAGAQDLLKAARASHAEYRQTFTGRGGKDPVGAAVEKILGRYSDTKATPDEIIRLSYGAGSEPGGGDAIKVAVRLKKILGETSPQWGAYKQGLFSHLTETAPGQAQRSAEEVANRIDRFLTSPRGHGLAKIAFSSEERAQLKGYADSLRALPSRNKPVTDVDKAIARITGADGHLPAAPSEVADMLYSRSGVANKGLSVRLAAHLKQNLKPESWTAVRQGMWEKLTNAGEGKIPFEAQALSQRLHEFLNESGSGLAKILFSPAEIAEMRKLASVHKMMTPKKGTTNPSGSATLGAKIASKAMDNLGAMLGFGAGGISGAVIGHGLQKVAATVKDAKAGKQATRLFFGDQPKVAARRDSRVPAKYLAPAAVASQR